MRGADQRQGTMFSYLSLEERVPQNHPLRQLQPLVNQALAELSPQFEELYSRVGRPSIVPEKLLRTLLLQVLYTVRSERMLVEQLDYNLLFRWFVGLGMDDPVWVATVFTKNRDRLLAGGVAQAFFTRVLEQARQRRLLSSEHFTVDGTLIEAWAGQKSFRKKDSGLTELRQRVPPKCISLTYRDLLALRPPRRPAQDLPLGLSRPLTSPFLGSAGRPY